MCDYSISAARQRDAKKEDELISKSFGSVGFGLRNDPGLAICLRPGTQLAFKQPVKYSAPVPGLIMSKICESRHTVATFRQLNNEAKPDHHRDQLEFPDGTTVLLANLLTNQFATVLQVPAQLHSRQAEDRHTPARELESAR